MSNTSARTLHVPDRATKSIGVKPGLWRQEVIARAARIHIEVPAPESQSTNMDVEFVKTNVTDRLQQATNLAYDRLNPVEWWSGSQIEAAWLQLRLAEESLIRATTDAATLKVRGFVALAHAKNRLDSDDPRVKALQLGLESPRDNPDELREASLSVVQASHEISDRAHQLQRSFRNNLRVVTVALILLAVAAVIGLSVLNLPDDLIAAPQGMKARDAAIAAMLVGGLGALFSAIPSLAQISEKATSFNPLGEQAVLKVVIGSWSAVVGLVVVAAGLTSSVDSELVATSPAGFVTMAALFGASQEALTRFADRKASAVAPSTT